MKKSLRRKEYINGKKRFEEVYKQGKLKIVKVIRDNETGVL
ncbi:DUF6440 family protein [Pseudogracilibacillus sp. SE30717A]